jgi:hypothetical protein
MKNMSGSLKRTEGHGAAEVACAKCDHRNAHGRNVCESCGAHLHVVCHHCGRRNARAQARCLECDHTLHRSRPGSLVRGLFGKTRDISTLQLVLLLIGVVIGGCLIYFIAEIRLPTE